MGVVMLREVNPLGSVVGRMRELSFGERRFFSVQDERTGRSVRCYFGDRDIDSIVDALGKRVVAFGRVLKIDGRPVRVDLRRLRVLGSDEDLPTADDLFGLWGDDQ